MYIKEVEQMEDTLDIMLTEDEAAELTIEVEQLIEAIRTGEVEGEYFEF